MGTKKLLSAAAKGMNLKPKMRANGKSLGNVKKFVTDVCRDQEAADIDED